MTVSELPECVSAAGAGSVSQPTKVSVGDLDARCAMTRRSALWAAYGDALGWISELTDSNGLKKRTGGAPLSRPIEWTRRIGGRAGITTKLPQGCYSDDSQLRLATGRAIGPDGFDVEAFAKVELPVWLSYGLGGGKATKSAATNLTKRSVPWYANTFNRWILSGGNGAAMRIQPHVWAAPDLDDPECYLPDVVRNSVCTHSHPIGLLGSVVHALTLAHTMAKRSLPSVDELLAAIETASQLPESLQKDNEMASYWRGTFEREAGDEFGTVWGFAIEECKEAVKVADESVSSVNSANRYSSLIERLRLRDPARRGSGLLTAIASVGLLWCESNPERALRIAANELGTDTDTIASMAGALVGATADAEPPTEVLDSKLFRSEADRLTKIAFGEQLHLHQYPDLLRWFPPSRRTDTLARTLDGGLYVRGLGPVRKARDPESTASSNFLWQWVELESGQSLFIKRRENLSHLEEESATGTGQLPLSWSSANGSDQQSVEIERCSAKPGTQTAKRSSQVSDSDQARSLDLNLALDYMIEHKDDDKALGAALRRVVKKGTAGQIAAFAAALIDELKKSDKLSRERHG